MYVNWTDCFDNLSLDFLVAFHFGNQFSNANNMSVLAFAKTEPNGNNGKGEENLKKIFNDPDTHCEQWMKEHVVKWIVDRIPKRNEITERMKKCNWRPAVHTRQFHSRHHFSVLPISKRIFSSNRDSVVGVISHAGSQTMTEVKYHWYWSKMS